MAKKPNRAPAEIADDLDALGARTDGATARQIYRLAAELRGEEPPLTPNEQREAERAEAAQAEAGGNG